MKKWKAVSLLTILSIILAFLVTMTFVRFPVGVKDYNSVLGAIDLDYDMAGGITYTLTLAEDNDKDVSDINEVIKTLSDRMNGLGYSEYSITALKPIKNGVEQADLEYDIRISSKQTDSISTDITTVTAYGTIQFFAGNAENPTDEVFDEINAIDKVQYVGSYEDSDGNTIYQVALRFTDEAYEEIKEELDTASTDGTSYYMSITLGETELLPGTSALSKDYFSDQTIYIQSSSEANAKQLALQLSTGGLEYKYDVSDPAVISAPLGENNALFSAIAVFALVVIAIVVFIVKFKVNGIVSAYSLITFAVTECAMMIAVPGIVFSVGGVLGAIVATILCIDGLVITFKRIEEESQNGKTKKSAVRIGFKRSFLPIVNTNLVAGVVGLMLYIFCNGVVRTFGIALGIGAVISFLVNVLISRMFVEIMMPLTKKEVEALETEKNVEGE